MVSKGSSSSSALQDGAPTGGLLSRASNVYIWSWDSSSTGSDKVRTSCPPCTRGDFCHCPAVCGDTAPDRDMVTRGHIPARSQLQGWRSQPPHWVFWGGFLCSSPAWPVLPLSPPGRGGDPGVAVTPLCPMLGSWLNIVSPTPPWQLLLFSPELGHLLSVASFNFSFFFF